MIRNTYSRKLVIYTFFSIVADKRCVQSKSTRSFRFCWFISIRYTAYKLDCDMFCFKFLNEFFTFVEPQNF